MNDKTEWVMVPRAPTPEMELAGKHTMKGAADMLFERFIAIAVYQSMLAAAPTPPAQEDQLDAAAAEIARLRSESATQSERLDALRADKDELQALCDKLAGLLSRTAVALRGPEPPLTRWSWHDLPERAQAAIAAIDLMERVAKNLAQDAPTPPGQDPREFPLDRMAENARELGLDYTPPDAQAQIDAAQEELRLCQQDAIKLQDECVALKAERDRLFNLLRKCANSMDAGRIDVDLIEEVRELFHKDRA